jgi:hypothetical protein
MEETTRRMKVSELVFDIKNPRLAEYDLSVKSSEAEVIKVLWDAMDVRELVMSIEASGFFPHEPIIVAHENGKNVVIEGNRRLAAVRLLLEPEIAETLKADVPTITEEAKDALRELPFVLDTRVNAWRYLGFKHVNGPAKWSSYAKSQYIANVHRNYGVLLEEIARQIGDTHRTVQRLYRGLMVIEQAERMKVFDRDDRYQKHFSFSHLYTGIGYDGIGSFIGLRPEAEESDEPVPIENKGQLGEICLWMYGSKRERTPPVVETQNPHLRYLDAVVSSKEAIAALRSGQDISVAYEISRPSSNVFEESLLASKRDLQKARGLLSTGYDGSEQLLRIAGDVADLAYDLYEEMERKRNPRPRNRASGRV